MKTRTLYIVLIIGLSTVLSCTKPIEKVDGIPEEKPIEGTEVTPKEQVSEEVKLRFDVDSFTYVDDLPQTKTALGENFSVVWMPSDTAGVFPETGGQVYFTMNLGEDATTASFDGGGWAFKSNTTYYSYYPFIGDIYLNRNHIPVTFVGQKQTGTDQSDHIGQFDYTYTDGANCIVNPDSGKWEVSFQYHHLCCILQPIITLQAGTWTKLAITAPSKVFAKNGWYDLLAASPTIVPTVLTDQMQIDLEGITLTEQTSFRVYLLTVPVNLQNTQITVSVRNSAGQEYQCTKTPSYVYEAGGIYGLTCTNWTEAPMSLIIGDWGDGGSISGTAE